MPDGGLGELFLELLEVAEGRVDQLGQLAAGRAAAVGRQAVPVEGVVPHLRGVVEHAALGLLDDALQRLVGELGALDQLVEVVHIGLVMLAVVEVDGLA
ncbi:hypothetical protein QE386_001588 [Pseudoxanthomonas winnipegensis]|nr:hypothetical protein [Pseudoxanthomonas winnipegensis]